MQCGWGASQLSSCTFAGERKGEEGEDSECTFVSLGRDCLAVAVIYCFACSVTWGRGSNCQLGFIMFQRDGKDGILLGEDLYYGRATDALGHNLWHRVGASNASLIFKP